MSEPHTQNFWERLTNLALIRFLLLFASAWALILLLDYFKDVIVIFTFAGIVAFLLSYPVRWLNRFLPRGVAVSLVFSISLLILGILTFTVGLAIVSQGQQLIDKIPEFSKSITPLLERLASYLRARQLQVDFDKIENFLRSPEEFIRTQFPAFLSTGIATTQILVDSLIKMILIEVVAFFMLLDGERLWGFLLKLVSKQLRSRFTNIVQRNFLGFFRGQMLLSLFFSTATCMVFLILQVPFPLVLAAIAGFFELIPGIGSSLGISLICFIVLPQNGWLALKVFITCIVIQQIKDNLVAPRIMQNSLNINPVVVFFALLVGYRLAGLLGIFLAIPIAGVVVSLFEIEDMKSISSDVT
ncbi:AI-2E family transporter [Argonema galeatum A003/A1]|nr:AI-2E family transporter [Argonema galeatum]MCL1466312.1 AI-2E family transporter [Argonema galeatum A003/A1]